MSTKLSLTTILKSLAAILILRVLATILFNYPDYFPPNFHSLFLLGREATFSGIYPVAFYIHIFSAPLVLLNGLILLSDPIRRRSLRMHRILGRIQAILLLFFVLPSSGVMSWNAFSGWPAGSSFLLLTICTGLCVIAGIAHVRRGSIALHRRWMTRSYVLLCSAVFLRLISGAANFLEFPDAELAYTIAAWSSWLVPLAGYEIFVRWKPRQSVSTETVVLVS